MEWNGTRDQDDDDWMTLTRLNVWILICLSNHSPFDVHVCAYWNAIKVVRWGIELHAHAPKAVKDVVLMMTMIRSIAAWSSISLLPNELLFLIFELLDFGSIVRARARSRPHLNDKNKKNKKCQMM